MLQFQHPNLKFWPQSLGDKLVLPQQVWSSPDSGTNVVSLFRGGCGSGIWENQSEGFIPHRLYPHPPVYQYTGNVGVQRTREVAAT